MRRTAIAPRLMIVIAFSTMPCPSFAGEYAPLNCNKASSATEKTICGSYALGQSEARMATLYSVASSLVAMGQRSNIQDAQRQWISTRNACGADIGCLTAAYDQRIRTLSGVIAAIASHGPY